MFHRYLDDVEIPESSVKNAHIIFKNKFTVCNFDKVIIYISADDYYKLYINGVFAGCGPAPGYYKSYNYNKIDISDYIINGENEITVHTYYQGLINRVWISGDNLHGLILDIVCDGKNILSSDENFLCARDTRYTELDIVGYNTGFCEHFDDSQMLVWKNAKINKNIKHNLLLQKTSMPEFEEILPVKTKKTDTGYFIDFGKNYCGYLKFKANGYVQVRYAQELSDNSIRHNMRANCTYIDTAKITGEFDSFDYRAFRYAQITADCDIKDIKLISRHYPLLSESVKCDDKELGEIFEMCRHTLINATQEAPLDCADRERGFYLADACYTALTIGKVFGDWSMFKKTVDDALKSAEYSPSLLGCINCSFIQEIAEFALIMINCVAIYLDETNDREYTDEIEDSLKAVLDYYKENYTDENGLISHIDKWCVAEWPDNFRDDYDVDLSQNKLSFETHCVINAYYYSAMVSMNKISGSKCYDTEKFKSTFLKAFYDKEKRLFYDSTVSRHSSRISNLFAYAFGLHSEFDVNTIDISLVNIFTTFPVLYKLKTDSQKDILLSQLKNKNAWLKMLSQGATTTFETWDKEKKWNTSLFHSTLSYAAFFIKDFI